MHVNSFFLHEPYLYKYCGDQIVRRCIPNQDFDSVLKFCHDGDCGGHFFGKQNSCQDIAK